jgi:hypothetical protein
LHRSKITLATRFCCTYFDVDSKEPAETGIKKLESEEDPSQVGLN